jgi:hypothetical protein
MIFYLVNMLNNEIISLRGIERSFQIGEETVGVI